MANATHHKSGPPPSVAQSPATPSADRQRAMLASMLRIRRFEERCAQSYQQAHIGGFCHLYIGQEATAVGTIAGLREDDAVITAYRDHGHALARGMDGGVAMAEMFGKITGCARGKGGSMHLFDAGRHMYGGHAIVGGQCPLAVGIAFAIRYQGLDRVCLCYFGDGALNQGALHESMNLSAIWKLPVVWVCENNRYSMGTAIDRGTAMADQLKLKADAYGMTYARCDGMDVLDTYQVTAEMATAVRGGAGPAFLEAVTYRYKGHSMSDPQKYRDRDEVVEMEQVDPITRLAEQMTQSGTITQEEVDALDQEARREALEAVKFAQASDPAPLEELYTDVYAMPYGPYAVAELNRAHADGRGPASAEDDV